MKKSTIRYLLVGLLAAQACAFLPDKASGQTITPSTNYADAWGFPYAPQPLRYSGYLTSGSPDTLIRSKVVVVSWKDLNPEEGVYKLDTYLDAAINAAPADGGVLFRLKASVFNDEFGSDKEEGTNGVDQTQMMPPWVVAKYSVPTFQSDTDKVVAAPWDAGVQKEFKRLIAEICRRGYLANPKVVGFYLHGVSSSNGEELNMNSVTYVNNAAATAGGTHSTLKSTIESSFPERMGYWETFGGAYARKIIWVGAGDWSGMSPHYDKNLVNAEAVAAGLGQRRGFIEHYLYAKVHPPLAGQIIKNFASSGSDGAYIETPWSAPVDAMRDGRYWGDENEESDLWTKSNPTWETDHPAESFVLYRSSFFRAAQLGMNFLWTHAKAVDRAGNRNGTDGSPIVDSGDAVPYWWRAIAGKNAALSPDAACWLRQATVTNINYSGVPTTIEWRNMERMVMQRDLIDDGTADHGTLLPNSLTVKTQSMTMPNLNNVSPDVDYTARKTNGTSSNYRMAFKLDPAFRSSIENGKAIQIRVHYLDNSTASWTVKVARGSGTAPISLGTVPAGSNDSVWKTAIFTLSGASLPFNPATSNVHLGKGIDFSIEVLNPASSGRSLTVRHVRVVRTEDVKQNPEILVAPLAQKPIAGTTVNLCVEARGPGSLSYQWLKNDAVIAGATGSALTITNFQSGNNGTYKVAVTSTVPLAGGGSPWTGTTTSTGAAVNLAAVSTFTDGSNATGWLSNVNGGGAITYSNPSANPTPAGGGSYLAIDYPLVTGTPPTNNWRYARKDFSGAFTGKKAVRFWIKGGTGCGSLQHGDLKLQIREGTSGERWNYSLGNVLALGTWQLVSLPLNSDYFTAEAGHDGSLAISSLDQVRFYLDNINSNVVIHVDDLQIVDE